MAPVSEIVEQQEEGRDDERERTEARAEPGCVEQAVADAEKEGRVGDDQRDVEPARRAASARCACIASAEKRRKKTRGKESSTTPSAARSRAEPRDEVSSVRMNEE